MTNGQLGGVKMNDFNTDLEYSLLGNDDQAINSFYFDNFRFLENIDTVTDLELQKEGIDKILTFKGGKQIFIDEKKRRKNYGDILLEEYSNYEKKVAGWLSHKKKTDYISYIIFDDKIVYLLPFLLLQNAWINNYNEWSVKYQRKFAKNPTYTTSNLAIPKQVLFGAIRNEMDIELI